MRKGQSNGFKEFYDIFTDWFLKQGQGQGVIIMYEIAICDDIPQLCEEVYRLVAEQLGKREIDIRIHTFHSGQALLSSGIVFDILFLDIELEKENGLEVAKEYPYKKETRIIFLTSHAEEMPNGYKVRAFRFLTKPVDVKHFEEALFSAIKDIE